MRSESNVNLRRAVRPGLLVLAAAIPWAGMVIASPSQDGHRRRTTDPPVSSKGKLGQDLFLAVGRRDLNELKRLLSIGADANSLNGLDLTPLDLAAASHQPDVMKTLMSAGAKLNLDSPYGNALTFAAMTGHAEGARILLAKGADMNASRADGGTTLMMAAQAGNPDFIAELVKRKVDVNQPSYNGSTPLSYAARMGHTAVGEMLLDAGAKIDVQDGEKETPLMLAAKAGHTDFLKMLVKRGAKVNVRSERGWTPLMLAAAYGDSVEGVRTLIAAGANIQAKDSQGWTAGTIAAARGYNEIAELLGVNNPSAKVRDPRLAAQKGLGLLERSMTSFNQGTACISCHQEGLGRMVTASAKLKGMAIDSKLEKAQVGRLRGAMGALRPLNEGALVNPEVMKQVPLIEMNEVNSGYGWMLMGMAAQNDTATASTAAMAMVLGRQQSPEGSWTFSLPRAPMQSSPFTHTAIAIRSLQAYGSRAMSNETQGRLEKASEWLKTAPAESTEDLAFRLMGMKWAGIPKADRRKAIDELLAGQRADGGWAQLPGMHSDAYATGEALYALGMSGAIETSSDVYRRGLNYLLRTQDADGSWFVNKRAIPVNNYFDAEFPHGESQYSSFNGTSWAVLAILEAMPSKK